MAHNIILERPKKIKGKYKYIRLSKGKTYPLARLIMEKYLNRKLDSREHVHHIDGNVENNDISNLIVLSLEKHLSLHHKGIKRKPLTSEHKNKISLKLKGRKKTFEHIQKVAEANKGKVMPIKVREKISNSLKGVKHTEERKRKTSEVIKKWWQQRKEG